MTRLEKLQARIAKEERQDACIAELTAENELLRKALAIYAKPENWTAHKTQHRRIWIYHCYEHGYKIAQSALNPQEEVKNERTE